MGGFIMKLVEKLKPYIISFIPVIIVAALSSMFAMQVDWYKKPSFQPPGWVFSAAWTVIYTLIGIAGGLIVKKKDYLSFGIYLINLFLNFLWTYIFFGSRMIGLALIEIVVLWVSIVVLFKFFRKTSALAAWLIVPYLLWVSFAFILNLAAYIIN
jgi:tryptophan-rich sensory protein